MLDANSLLMSYNMSSRLNAASPPGGPSPGSLFSANVNGSPSVDDTPSINTSSPFDILYTNNDSTPIGRLPDELLLRAFELLSSQNLLVDIGDS